MCNSLSEIKSPSCIILLVAFILFLMVIGAALYHQYLSVFVHGESTVPLQAAAPAKLAKSKINKLPVVAYNDSALDAECSICLGAFVKEERVKIMPDCKHCFHSECIDQWLGVHSSCPVCRAVVQVDDDSPV